MLEFIKSLLCSYKELPWSYGYCRKTRARRNHIKGNVQFVFWKAGEHGHTEDYWHDFNSWWWPCFRPDPIPQNQCGNKDCNQCEKRSPDD